MLAPGFEVPGFEPEFELPGFEPGFEVPGFVDPPLGCVFGFEGDPGVVEPGVFGLFGLVAPGVFGLFGFVAPGVFGLFGFVAPGSFGLLEFGLLGFDPGVAFPVGGSAVLPVGGSPVFPVGGCVVLPVGGWAELPVGGADGDAWPGVPEPAGGAPPAGAACATTQVAQNRSTDNNVSFLGDIMRPPALNSLAIPWPACGERCFRKSIGQV